MECKEQHLEVYNSSNSSNSDKVSRKLKMLIKAIPCFWFTDFLLFSTTHAMYPLTRWKTFKKMLENSKISLAEQRHQSSKTKMFQQQHFQARLGLENDHATANSGLPPSKGFSSLGPVLRYNIDLPIIYFRCLFKYYIKFNKK